MSDAPAQAMTERHLRITRVFDAPRDLLWTCWTEPEHVASWWGPEHFHTPVESVEVDPRPGGVFKTTMVDPQGNEYPSSGIFVEVVPKERLVFAEEGICHPMIESQHTIITFEDLGDGRTQLDVDVTMVCLDELIPLAESGWNSQFDKLVVVLAQG